MPEDVKNTEEMIELETDEGVEVALSEDDAQVSEPEPEVEQESEEISEEPTEEELAQYSAGVRKRIDKLTAKYREAERREQAALDYAKSVQAENQGLQQNATQLTQKYSEE
tara:strand:+ start:132 stop:464 length:333 start_codon:yes stop_codon:yes gene_type:complete